MPDLLTCAVLALGALVGLLLWLRSRGGREWLANQLWR